MGRPVYWTFEKVKLESEKYEARTKFARGSPVPYEIARKNGWLDDLFIPHYSKEKIRELAKAYTSRSKFKKDLPGAYKWAKRNDMLDELFDLVRVYWNFNSVSIEALKYFSRMDFKNGCFSAYNWAVRNKVLDKVCEHMTPRLFHGWTAAKYIDFVNENHNGICTFYLIECQDQFEKFILFGVTTAEIECRYNKLENYYDWEVILQFQDSVENIIACEKWCKTDLKNFKYIPNCKLGGLPSESLSIPKTKILKLFGV